MHAVMGSGRLIAGRYRLQGPIGRGAMGIVWRGRDELLARDVAVKEVQITAQASPADAEGIYQRTLREARTAARLSHPGVVTVFDVVEENGSPWIVMELVNARSLDRVITEDGPLPPLQAAELGASLVGALATAHAAGVLHRDVKPSNVLVTEDGKAVLTDFGIATFAEDPSLTLVGMVVGTPGFTAPERVRGNGATPASDLWSLGATLYAAVEGRGPFDRVGGSAAIIAGVANEAAPRAPSAGPLGPVIDALLSREPGTRPDATTAARLLTDAATAARTGARPLGDGWLAAEASTAERDAVSDADADDPVRGSAHAAEVSSDEQRAAFLDPPVFGELSIPEWTGPADALEASLGSRSLDETPLVAAGQFGDVALADGIGLGAADAAVAAVGLGAADAGIGLGAADAGIGLGAATQGSRWGPPTRTPQRRQAPRTTQAPRHGPNWQGSVRSPVRPKQRTGLAAGVGGAATAAAGLAGSGAAGLAGSGAAGPAGAGGTATAAGPTGAAGNFAEPAAGSAAGTVGLAGPQLAYGGDSNPVLWEPFKPTSGGSGAGGSSPDDSGATQGSGGAGTGGNGGGWFRHRGGPAKPSSGRWRLMVAGAGIAAIVIAAVDRLGHLLADADAAGSPGDDQSQHHRAGGRRLGRARVKRIRRRRPAPSRHLARGRWLGSDGSRRPVARQGEAELRPVGQSELKPIVQRQPALAEPDAKQHADAESVAVDFGFSPAGPAVRIRLASLHCGRDDIDGRLQDRHAKPLAAVRHGSHRPPEPASS